MWPSSAMVAVGVQVAGPVVAVQVKVYALHVEAPQHVEAQQHQHYADAELQGRGPTIGERETQQDGDGADREERQAMP